VVDNGVDTAGYEFFERPRAEAKKFLFLGSLDWRPNLDAVYFLLDNVWPSIRLRYPNAHLDIVGRSPCQALIKRITAVSGCSLHANVPDVRPFLATSTAMLVPLRVGGGSRLKVLEAAAAGLPVISTAVGIEGLELEAGTYYILADTAEEMIAAVSNICERDNPSCLTKMTKAARQLVEERYDWSSLADKLASVWKSSVVQAERVTI
jgi:glycosyltransferase involved in cell wall biosynthesis